MMLLIVELSIAVACFVLGGLVGRWFRKPSTAAGDSAAKTERANEALNRLRELSLSIKENVGQHSSEVSLINEELLVTEGLSEVESRQTARASIGKLISTNERMQQQLAVAEQRLQRQAEEIQQHVAMARTDALTGLANRRAFDEHLHMRLADWRRHEIPTSLVMIDVDHFKKFNDTHGHQAGDAVLRGVAKVLVDEMRDTDLVARLGGEEIAIVLPRTELLEATRVAERGRLAIADMSINYSGQSLRVSASFGVSKIVGGDGAETLIRRADQALYAAKQNGRNKTYIDDGKGSVEADSYLESCDAPSTPAPTRPETSSNGTRPSPSTARKADRLEPAPPLAAALPNRSAFCDELRRLLAQREMNDASLVVAMFKIDNLSKFKSSHGAPAVEQISKSLVRIAGAILRRDDTLARIGENHYAISMPNQSLKDAVVSAQRLVEAVDQAREENPDQSWSISVGLASAVGADTLATLVQRGEDTLAQATGAGVGQIAVFDGTTSRLLQSTRV